MGLNAKYTWSYRITHCSVAAETGLEHGGEIKGSGPLDSAEDTARRSPVLEEWR